MKPIARVNFTILNKDKDIPNENHKPSKNKKTRL